MKKLHFDRTSAYSNCQLFPIRWLADFAQQLSIINSFLFSPLASLFSFSLFITEFTEKHRDTKLLHFFSLCSLYSLPCGKTFYLLLRTNPSAPKTSRPIVAGSGTTKSLAISVICDEPRLVQLPKLASVPSTIPT